ncbi:MAG TPA: hypothetical protein VGE11_09375 [Pseudonocardia sp.]
MTDDEAADTVEPVGGLLLAQTGLEQDRGHRFHQCERRLRDRRSRPEQRNDLRVGEDGGPRRARDRAQVLGPPPRECGQLDLREDKLDHAIEQRGLVRDMAVNGHRVDTSIARQPTRPRGSASQSRPARR